MARKTRATLIEENARLAAALAEAVAAMQGITAPAVDSLATDEAPAASDPKPNLFGEGVWNRYGLTLKNGKPVIGSTFQSKHGTTFEVRDVTRKADGRRVAVCYRA